MRVLHAMRRVSFGFYGFVLALSWCMYMFPHQVSAAQITARSVQMSSSSGGATPVTYKVSFTTATTSVIQGVVVDFCLQTPIVGDTNCTKPTGFSVGTPTVANISASLTTAGSWTAGQLNANRTLTLTNASNGSVAASAAISFDITTVTNPTADNTTFYARVLTYATSAGATAYTAATPGTHVDDGGIAISTGEVITITARVMETLVFCVYKTTCADDPSFTIGHGANSILDTSTVDTQDVKFSLSTNAQSGVALRLKGDTLKAGSNSIAAKGAVAGSIAAGTAAFGIFIQALGTGVSASSPYSSTASNYAFDVANTTSTYGQTIATLSAPVNNSVTTLRYGATAGSTTAAGIYTASHQLIATGQF